jgi:hypothetical protein
MPSGHVWPAPQLNAQAVPPFARISSQTTSALPVLGGAKQSHTSRHPEIMHTLAPSVRDEVKQPMNPVAVPVPIQLHCELSTVPAAVRQAFHSPGTTGSQSDPPSEDSDGPEVDASVVLVPSDVVVSPSVVASALVPPDVVANVVVGPCEADASLAELESPFPSSPQADIAVSKNPHRTFCTIFMTTTVSLPNRHESTDSDKLAARVLRPSLLAR